MVGPIDFETPNADKIFDGDVVIRDSDIQSRTRTRIRLDKDTGSIFTHNNDGDITFHWDRPNNNLFFGGHGQDGDLVIFPRNVNSFRDISKATFHFNGQQAVARLGGNQIPGQIVCQDENDEQTVFINGAEGQIIAGANGKNGTISVQNQSNQAVIHLSGEGGTTGNQPFLRIGGRGTDGNLRIFSDSSESGEPAIALSGSASSLILGNRGSQRGQIFINNGDGLSEMILSDGSFRARGANGGSLSLFPNTPAIGLNNFSEATFHFQANTGVARIGGGGSNNGRDGYVSVGGELVETVRLIGRSGGISSGGNGIDGDLFLHPRHANDGPNSPDNNLQDRGQSSIHLKALTNDNRALIRVGGGAHTIAGEIQVRNSNNQTTIQLDGQAGDIILSNADCAEDFEVALGVEVVAGTVMVLDTIGKLKPSSEPYDKRVVGIIAGAGSLRPGIVLGRHDDSKKRMPVALFGRTYCRVDASTETISVGDLLTTSSVPGVAMKAVDSSRSFGAIIGKALEPAENGLSMIGSIPVWT